MKNTTLSRALLALVASLGVPAAMAQAPAQPLTWSANLDALSMDPHSTNNSFTNAFVSNIYEALVRFNDKLQIEPALATSWKVMSPTVWRFTLRQGVKFHNGESFDADDVVFSWQRVNTPGSLVKGNLSDLKDVRKVDAFTVDVETHAPMPILTNELVQLLVMDKGWSEANRATEASDLQKQKENHANRNTNGTGPFQLKSRDVDTRTVLSPFAGWWDKPKHNLGEVTFMPIKSDATRTSALISGNIDASVSVPLQDVPRLQSSGVEVVQGPELRTIFLGMDQMRDDLLYSDVKGKNPFKDKRVRQAVYHAIDIEAIKRSVMRNASWPTGMLLSPYLNGAPASLNKRALAYDQTAAKKLLAEAGYPNGFGVTLDCVNVTWRQNVCQAAVSMLAQVGIRASLRTTAPNLFFPKLTQGTASFIEYGWTASPDAWASLNGLFRTFDRAGLGTFNAGRYSNPKLDVLIDNIRVEPDLTRRRAMVTTALRLIADDLPYIPLYRRTLNWAMSRKVTLVQWPSDQIELRWVKVR